MKITEFVTEDWQKTNRKDKTSGMSRKAVKQYRRENPGSKLQTAVTTKPSKLKKGSKSAKRRKSFCARMRGMKKSRTSAKTARNPNSNINKALRRWNCESIEQMQELVMIAEQKIAALRQGMAEGFERFQVGDKISFPLSQMATGIVDKIDDKRLYVKLDNGEVYTIPSSMLHSVKLLERQGVAEGKDDLSQYSTERLQAYVKKVSGGGVPAFGSGAKLKRVQAELKRRERGVAEGEEDIVAVIDGVRSDRTYNDRYHAHNSLSKLVGYGKAKVAELYINGEKVEHFELGKKYIDFEPKSLGSMSEAGPFSYGAKKPRKGSVADLAAKKRREQEKDKQPAEPRDHMIGVAKVVKELNPDVINFCEVSCNVKSFIKVVLPNDLIPLIKIFLGIIGSFSTIFSIKSKYFKLNGIFNFKSSVLILFLYFIIN